jgi:DNA-directed RNA polymerase specialized sigma24 family protein
LENTLIKETLKDHLASGKLPAIRFLYTRYSSMLFGYVLQFIPDKKEAEKLLIVIFAQLANRLHEACLSASGIYCWMQAEARKIILDHFRQSHNGHGKPAPNDHSRKAWYLAHLQDASDDQKRIFRLVFFEGCSRETVAQEIHQDVPTVKKLLRESLLIIRKKLA